MNDRRKILTSPSPGLTAPALALLALCSLLPCHLFAQSQPPFPRVGPGLEYIHRRIGDVPWSIHVAKISRSPSTFRFASTLARGSVYGLARVRDQVQTIPSEWGRPVAAVNGDFFVIRPGPYQGDPSGLHIAAGELVSSPIGTTFWIDSSGSPHIAQVFPAFRLTWPDGNRTPFALNQQRADDAAVLYTPTLGPSTRTTSGVELILEKSAPGSWLPLRPGSSFTARVTALNDRGDTTIPPEAMVFSIGPELAKRLPALEAKITVSLSLETSPSMEGVETAVGGGPVLVAAGRAQQWDPNKPLPRHPRTAIGYNDEYFFLVVVDGRQKNLSAGMNYPELAALMLQLGCREAMNLDGGGSSTLWLGGTVTNSPSDGPERRVANAIVVLRTEQQ